MLRRSDFLIMGILIGVGLSLLIVVIMNAA